MDFLFLSQAHNGMPFLVSGALIGIGYGTIVSNFQAIAIQQSSSNRKALATSTYFMFLDLSNGVGPYITGILIGFMSFRHLYLTMTIWIMIGMGIYYAVHGRKSAMQEKACLTGAGFVLLDECPGAARPVCAPLPPQVRNHPPRHVKASSRWIFVMN
ncbi:MFS transporter [Terrilactibacillus sp. S3-3]|nr:MFS transporter [Terrilactibacillus sp. S3-3]